MGSKKSGSLKCPEGYRRYVYRVNLSVPFKQEPGLQYEEIPETQKEIEERLEAIATTISELEKERKLLKEHLEQLKQP